MFKDYGPEFSRTQAKGLLQFGGWVTVTSLVGPMMVVLDRFVIGATLGAKAVTYYTVPFQLAQRTITISGSIASALFPRFAAADKGEAQQLAIKAIRSVAVVTTPLIFVSVLIIEPFLRWWINPEFASHAGLTTQILLLGFWINGFATIPYALLQASGKPGLVAKCHMAELVPYLVLLYVGLYFWGLPSAAVAFGLRASVDWALLMFFLDILSKSVQILMLPSIMLFGGLAISLGLTTSNVSWWLAAFSGLFILLGWAWRMAPTEVRDLLIGMVNKYPTKKKGKA